VNGLPNRNVRPSGSPRSTCGKPFRNAANAYAPQAAILFDTFHVIRHLGEALDKVRKSEYARLSGKDRRFIKARNTR
jgi:transposase